MWGGRPSVTFQVPQGYWDSYQCSRGVKHRHLLKHWTPRAFRGVKGMWDVLSWWGGELGLSLGTPQGIQTSIHLVRWKTSLHSSHSRNPAFFQVRASRCPFQLRQQTQGPCHKPIGERSLLLRSFWKVGIPLESKPEIQLSSRENLEYTKLSSSCCAELGVPPDLGCCSQGISGVA